MLQRIVFIQWPVNVLCCEFQLKIDISVIAVDVHEGDIDAAVRAFLNDIGACVSARGWMGVSAGPCPG